MKPATCVVLLVSVLTGAAASAYGRMGGGSGYGSGAGFQGRGQGWMQPPGAFHRSAPQFSRSWSGANQFHNLAAPQRSFASPIPVHSHVMNWPQRSVVSAMGGRSAGRFRGGFPQSHGFRSGGFHERREGHRRGGAGVFYWGWPWYPYGYPYSYYPYSPNYYYDVSPDYSGSTYDAEPPASTDTGGQTSGSYSYYQLGGMWAQDLRRETVTWDQFVQYLKDYIVGAPPTQQDDFRRGFLLSYGINADAAYAKAVAQTTPPPPAQGPKVLTVPPKNSD